jgi:amidase
VLVMPTARHLPEPVPTPPSDPLEALEASLLGGRWLSAQNTQPFNYSGHPALAVPCAKVGGLPTSMQLVGRYFDDALLLRVAQAYESAVDWDALTSAQLGAH